MWTYAEVMVKSLPVYFALTIWILQGNYVDASISKAGTKLRLFACGKLRKQAQHFKI